MARFPVARLLLALLATAFTNAQVDQAQYSIPCVMQYVGCVLIPNFNTAFSRLLGDNALTPGKCQRFCSNLGSTGCYHYHVRNQQYHCHDIVFILDDDLSDNHRHALDNVVTDFNLLRLLVTDFNLLRLLVIFVLLDDLNALNDLDNLNNLNDKKHPNVPTRYIGCGPLDNSMVSDVDLLFNPYVANQPVECQQYCKTNRRTITMMSKFLCICSILVPGAVTPFSSEIPPNDNYCTNPCSSFPSAPCGARRPGVHRVRAGREPTQLYEFEFIFDHLLYFDYVFSFVEFSCFGFWKQYNICDNFKPVSDLEHFSLDYTSVKRSQQRRIISYNFTAFLNVPYFSPFFSPCFSLF
ncbi:hypothetical protein HER10_EVM0005853 [Colletotrichum scovillei]|uniref:uncharacterized protein n=1 Tax=Colletotrichum scovillei TaxID=1209932 RepID=UPI0015C37ACE|nr:uncharacterized protein HER10_EVM0005853 [Colletotrichum scovillei]KAF4785386.1 hypothetical protein HER10_EVM0005853 [Colletotrichum scovillei]